jgi:hypothetical protein
MRVGEHSGVFSDGRPDMARPNRVLPLVREVLVPGLQASACFEYG